MSTVAATVSLSPHDYDAVLFDLDGVLTPTADVHATAWKRLFDDFLSRRAQREGTPFVPFDRVADYRRYVDGKPRYDGVADFLASRGIDLSRGGPDDAPGDGSVHALGNLKDRHFMQQLAAHGVAPFEGVVELLEALRAQEIKTAVVSSSSHARDVLNAAGIAHLLDVRVDGNDLRHLRLRGKPAPDAFLEAARQLRVDPWRAAVVEDSIAGVEAGRAGQFCFVIGVDRIGASPGLRQAGADAVVSELTQLQLAIEPAATWSLVYEDYDSRREGIREALCALGNGYFAVRGAMPWARSDEVHYPGTYLAGGYNRLTTEIEGEPIENEDLVNLPNCLWLTFRLGQDPWFDERRHVLLAYRQELDLRRGVLQRLMTFRDAEGRRTSLRERRLVSMSDMHLAALELSITAENWQGSITVRSGIDGRVVNSGAHLYREFNNVHLEPLAGSAVGDDGVNLLVRTVQSGLRVAQSAATRAYRDEGRLPLASRLIREPGCIAREFDVALGQGQTVRLEKTVFLYTSRDAAISECSLAAEQALSFSPRFEAALASHVLAWKHLWRRFDMHLQPEAPGFALNVPMLLRLNMLHLLQTASTNSIGLDMGIPARGWTGEAYQGHIFWDELFIFPFLNYRMPEITRSLLMYRYRRLNAARRAAREAGFEGAMFPWQSGSTGEEQTLDYNLNARSGRWMRDNTFLQRHAGSAVAWNVWQYYQVTGDLEFLQAYGAELLIEIARFWSSIATLNPERGRYEIHGVMGPDEFHDAYPDSTTPGLNNNAYTNVMASWVLQRAREALALLPDIRRAELWSRLNLTAEEIARWEEVNCRLFVPFHGEGIISQFEGYERLADLDWKRYRMRYGNIQRLDLILEAENDSANRYKVSKQADVLMLFYLFSSEELRELFAHLGYPFDDGMITRNVAYYDERSSHGSTLSRVVHAWVLARHDRARALRYFAEALQSDVSDIQQGTTAEGVHLGAMAGTVDLVQRVTTGIEITADVLRFNPRLPEGLARLDLRVRYRGHTLDLRLMPDTFSVRCRKSGVAPIRLAFRDHEVEFAGGMTRVFTLRTSEPHAKRP